MQRTHSNGGMYLCSGEENVIRYVADSAGYNAQSDSRKDVGIVTLSGVEGASICQRHLMKGTSTSKDAPTLVKERRRSEFTSLMIIKIKNNDGKGKACKNVVLLYML